MTVIAIRPKLFVMNNCSGIIFDCWCDRALNFASEAVGGSLPRYSKQSTAVSMRPIIRESYSPQLWGLNVAHFRLCTVHVLEY